MRKNEPDRAFFLARVDIDPSTQCWVWRGAKQEFGHGCMRYGSGGMKQAHRVAYEILVGPIPAGLIVRHKCHRTSCVNPEHLELGTMSDNTQDRWRDGTMHAGSKCSATKLTDADVLAIRASYPAKSMAQLAKEYNSAGIFNIIHRKTWKHI